jgi:hypothetical protein
VEDGVSRIEQLEAQLDGCLESLMRVEEELLESEIRVNQLTEELSAIVFSRAWKFTSALNDFRLRLAPRGSRREKTVRKMLSKLRSCFNAMRHPPIKQLPARALGILKSHTPTALKRYFARHRDFLAKFMPERAREYLRVTMDMAVNLRTPLWERLGEFLETEVKNNAQGRVFIFYSGTTFTESEGQRPTRLARELAKRGIPVIFCYWRWKTSEPPQIAKFPHVFCLPIDEFTNNFDSLLADPRFSGLSRSLVMEFPYPGLMEVVNYANAFGWKTVYDVIDDWEEFHRCGQAFWFDAAFESYLLHNADLSTFTCPTLLAKLAVDREHCEMLPNAFEDWAASKMESIEHKASSGKITIGYFGHLTSSWFDWPLVVETAKKHPDWTFEIIGYGMDAKLESLPNIVHLGKVEHCRLPDYAKRWDVAMIPFKPSKLSEAVDPIKIYEYIALELPTVVTGMPHLASYPGVFTAESLSEFETAVEHAVENPLNDETVRRFLGDNRWSNRVDRLLALLDQAENRSAVSKAFSETAPETIEKAA